MRAFSPGESVSMRRPLNQYRPLVGVSSSARIDRNVDLPQPDGPETETYSPRSMSIVTPSSARVSPSSAPAPALNTLLTPSKRMSGRVAGSTAGSSTRSVFSRFHQAIVPPRGFDVHSGANVGERSIGLLHDDVSDRVVPVPGRGGDQ